MKVGSLVQCVDSFFPPSIFSKIPNRPNKGDYYMVRQIAEYQGKIGILLEELSNPLLQTRSGLLEPSFRISRFR